MIVWRLASGRYDPLDGEGARRVGGRWNSAGRPVIYTSETLSLALVEALVHLPTPLPKGYMAFRIEIPDTGVEMLDLGVLSAEWQSRIIDTRAVGDGWLQEERSLALGVPSVIVPEERNVLINPIHRDAGQLRAVDQRPFAWDPRLRPHDLDLLSAAR